MAGVDPFGDPSKGGSVDPFGDPVASAPKPEGQSKTSLFGPTQLGSAIAEGRGSEEFGATAKKASDDLLGFIEGATAGIPRGAIEAMTDFKIPRGSMVGQTAGFIAGPGKVANMAGKAVGKKVFGEAVKGTGRKVAEATSSGFVGNAVKAGLKKGAVTGATEGAVGGALFPQDEAFNLRNRFVAGLTGAGIGAPLGATIGGLGAWGKAKVLNSSAKKVVSNLEKIRGRGEGKGTSEGAIYDLPGNPSNITKRSVKNPVTGKVEIQDAPARSRKSFTPGVEGFKKVSDREAGAIKQGGKSKINFLRQQKDEAITGLKLKNEEDLARLEMSKNGIEEIFSEGSDEAINTVKKLGPKWIRAKYNWYGNSLDKIASDMAEDGVSVKVSSLSDELSGILKNRRIGLEAQAETATASTSERAVSRWFEKLASFRQYDKATGAYRDGAMQVSDILDEMSRIRELGDDRMNREISQALTNVLEKSGGAKYAERITNLKKEYAKFVPLRDLVENSFEPQTENVMGGKRLLENLAKKKSGVVDRTLDVDTIRKLENLEKELGVPFLQKLRSYGDQTEVLASQEQALKKMLSEKLAATRSSTAEAMRGVRTETTDALAEQAKKLARTEAVNSAIEARLKGRMNEAFLALKIPETIARQMATAGFAYLLTLSLGKMIRGERN